MSTPCRNCGQSSSPPPNGRPGRLWVPENRVLSVPAPALHLTPTRELVLPPVSIGYAGAIGYEIVRPDGSVRLRVDPQSNIILDGALDYMLTNSLQVSQMKGWAAVGTGTATPLYTDTTLQNQVGITSDRGGFNDEEGFVDDATNPYYWHRRVFLFPTLGADYNLSEVLIYYGGSYSDGRIVAPFAKSLIKNSQGEVAVVSVRADEQLKLFYEFRAYPPTAALPSVPFTAVVHGVDTVINVTPKPANTRGGNEWGYLADGGPFTSCWRFKSLVNRSTPYTDFTGTATSGATGSASEDTYTSEAYIPGTFYRETESIWEPAKTIAGNQFNGVALWPQGSCAGWVGLWYMEFDQYLPKTTNDRVTIRARYHVERRTIP